MAIKTQIRLSQLTGSFSTATGGINDQLSATATGSIESADLSTVLGHMASSIQRIHGGASFSETSAGQFATGTFSGILKTDDATEATTTTDGSLQTDGGLSVAKSAVIGDDLDLLSNSAVFKVGNAEPFTLTHANANNTLLATADHRLAFGHADEYITGTGTHLDIVSGDEIRLSATSDVVIPANVGLHLGNGNVMLESDNTDLTVTLPSGGDINIPAAIGVKFGADSNGIEASSSGNNLTISAGGDVIVAPSGGNLKPNSDNQVALGENNTGFSDLFLGSGAVVNFHAGAQQLTHGIVNTLGSDIKSSHAASISQVELTSSQSSISFVSLGSDIKSSTGLQLGNTTFTSSTSAIEFIELGSDLSSSHAGNIVGSFISNSASTIDFGSESNAGSFNSALNSGRKVRFDDGSNKFDITFASYSSGQTIGVSITNLGQSSSVSVSGLQGSGTIKNISGSSTNAAAFNSSNPGATIRIETGGGTSMEYALSSYSSGTSITVASATARNGSSISIGDLIGGGSGAFLKVVSANASGASSFNSALASGRKMEFSDGTDKIIFTFSSYSGGSSTLSISAQEQTAGSGAVGMSALSSSGHMKNVTASSSVLDIGPSGTTDLVRVGSDDVTLKGELTVGVDDTGYDVKFFGATSGQFMLWDQSADELVLAGDSKLSFNDAAGGENIIASSDGHLEVNAGTTLDVTAPTVQFNATTVDINGAVDASSTITAAGRVIVDDATEATSATDGSLQTDGGLSVVKSAVIGDDLDLLSDSAIMSFGADKDVTFTHDGSNGAAIAAAGKMDITAGAATTIKTTAGDLTIDSDAARVVLTGSSGADSVLIQSDATVSGALLVSGDLTVNGSTVTVNSTTVTIDDPIFTLGGDTAPSSDDNKDRGVEFRYYDSEARIGFMGWDDSASGFTLLSAASNSSEVFSGTAAPLVMGALGASTGTFSGVLKTDDATDATSKTDGSLQTDGGLSVAKAIYNGTAATLAADSGVVTIGSTTAATFSAAGLLNINNATEATSTTDGSLQTDGGLSVVKSAVIGDDLDLLSDSAIMSFGADKDITLTHVADTGLTLGGSNANGTNLQITNSATDGDAAIQFALGGTVAYTMGVEDGDSDKFVINYGTGALGAQPALEVSALGAVTANVSLTLATGSTCTAIKDEDNMASNSDTALATQQSIKAYVDSRAFLPDMWVKEITSAIAADGNCDMGSPVSGSDSDAAFTSSTTLNKIQIFVNGQLQYIGTDLDVELTSTSRRLKFQYPLVVGDIIVVHTFVDQS